MNLCEGCDKPKKMSCKPEFQQAVMRKKRRCCFDPSNPEYKKKKSVAQLKWK